MSALTLPACGMVEIGPRMPCGCVHARAVVGLDALEVQLDELRRREPLRDERRWISAIVASSTWKRHGEPPPPFASASDANRTNDEQSTTNDPSFLTASTIRPPSKWFVART